MSKKKKVESQRRGGNGWTATVWPIDNTVVRQNPNFFGVRSSNGSVIKRSDFRQLGPNQTKKFGFQTVGTKLNKQVWISDR